MSSFRAFLLMRTLFSKPILHHVPLDELVFSAFLDCLFLPLLRLNLLDELEVDIYELL